MALQAPVAPDPVAEWIAFVERPENANRNFECINGEMVEKMPGTAYNPEIAFLIAFAIRAFCLARNIICHITTGDGAFDIQGNVVAPDVAFKQTPSAKTYPDFEPPLWAVEVISPNDKADGIRDKRQVYLDAGILYWEVYPKSKRVDVYAPGQPLRSVDAAGTLDGGAVLPGFTLAAAEIWRD
jgi:Uma2 family endonuclease